MNNKIARKLILYFAISLIVFSVIIGGVFTYLFKKHSMDIHKKDLEKKAVQISSTLANYWSDMSQNGGHRQGSGYGAYMKFLDDIAMSDIWVVDKDYKIITYGKGNKEVNYSQLPEGADNVINEAFKGKTYFSEDFNGLLGAEFITVAAPIKSDNGVIGVVLLHSPIEGIDSAVSYGFKTLAISIIIALSISGVVSILLSLSFTRPLKKMKETAELLAEGDYKIKTGIKQNDEIGDLAKTIDILSNKLYDASKESEKLECMRRDFVSNISHELRTPVTVIRGSLEAICDGIVEDKEEVYEYSRQMLLETIYLQSLVNDLLDLSRLQNTDFKIEMVKLNLCDVIDDVIRSMNKISKCKNIKIIKNENIKDCKVKGDYSRIRQMIIIILDNAIKFSKNNENIKIDLSSFENYYTLTISNVGVGIAKEELPYIFDRFYKSRSEENKSGTGLGLAIAKQIADRHNIKIEVCSEINNITQFKFIIRQIQ